MKNEQIVELCERARRVCQQVGIDAAKVLILEEVIPCVQDMHLFTPALKARSSVGMVGCLRKIADASEEPTLREARDKARQLGIAVTRRHYGHGITEIQLIAPCGIRSMKQDFTTGNAKGQARFISKAADDIHGLESRMVKGKAFTTLTGNSYALLNGFGAFKWDRECCLWVATNDDISWLSSFAPAFNVQVKRGKIQQAYTIRL